MRFAFVRHGESLANAEGWYASQRDVPLTERGVAQALQLVAQLRDEPITSVYASDLQRASATAAPVAAHFGLSVRTTPALRERELGAWSGRAWEGDPQVSEVVMRSFRERPPGGESIADVVWRAADFLKDLPVGEGTRLIVAHGGLLRGLCGLIDKMTETEITHNRFANAAPVFRDVEPSTFSDICRRLRPPSAGAVPIPEEHP